MAPAHIPSFSYEIKKVILTKHIIGENIVYGVAVNGKHHQVTCPSVQFTSVALDSLAKMSGVPVDTLCYGFNSEFTNGSIEVGYPVFSGLEKTPWKSYQASTSFQFEAEYNGPYKAGKWEAKAKADNPVSALAEELPGVNEVVSYPCDHSISFPQALLKNVIIHLNDQERWTRHQIADWLETLEIDLRFK